MYNTENISKLKKENPEFAKSFDEMESYYSLALRRINHEFGNALTLVNSSLQIIESSHPEVRDFKYWDSAMEDVHHMVRLVSEISSYNNCSTIKKESVDICEIIASTLNSFSINPDYSNITFTLNCDKHVPSFSGDNMKIRQAIINLIKNAAEAITGSGQITTTISHTTDYIYLNISDNGCGITADQLKHIFSPLVSYKNNGTGLGLPITKRIIEAHNGTIRISSEPGKGTSFNISFPV